MKSQSQHVQNTSSPSSAPSGAALSGSGKNTLPKTGTNKPSSSNSISATVPASASTRIGSGGDTNVVNEFKKSLAWKMCTAELLDPPLPVLNPLIITKDDTEETKRMKTQKYEDEKNALALTKKSREQELLSKLQDVISRVLESRVEKQDSMTAWQSMVGHDKIYSDMKCNSCGNKDQNYFKQIPYTGDTVCLGKNGEGCGMVVQDHRVEEGAEFRRFSDDEGKDRNHFGPSPDPLMSDSENMRTTIIGSDASYKKLLQAHQYVEMNLSNMGTDDRRTRIEYKNHHKKEIFELMTHIAASQSIHQSVVDAAKIEFARYRDLMDHVHKPHSVAAACLIIAFEEIWKSGNVNLLKKPMPKIVTKAIPLTISSAADNTPSILQSNDPAVLTLNQVPMAKWTVQQIESWLQAVLQSLSLTSDMIMNIVSTISQHIQSGRQEEDIEASSSSKKRKITTSMSYKFLGTTSVANRRKKYGNHNNSDHDQENASSSSLSKHLISLKFDQVLKEFNQHQKLDEIIQSLKTAVVTRTAYETALRRKKEEEERESIRKRTEKGTLDNITEIRSTSQSSAIKSSLAAPSSLKTSEEEENSGGIEADDFLSEMLLIGQAKEDLRNNGEDMIQTSGSEIIFQINVPKYSKTANTAKERAMLSKLQNKQVAVVIKDNIV